METKQLLESVELNHYDLGKMFSLKKNFLEVLNTKSPIPTWPADLSSKVGQSVFREMCTRTGEECAETYTAIILFFDLLGTASRTQEKVNKAIVEISGEVADTFQFLLNVMIYAGVTANEIGNWYNSEELDLEYSILGKSIYLANMELLKEGLKPKLIMRARWTDETDPYYNCGKNLSLDAEDVIMKLSWDLTHSLFMVANLMKLRSWRNDRNEVDRDNLLNALSDCWAYFFKWAVALGVTEEVLQRLFEVKLEYITQRLTK